MPFIQAHSHVIEVYDYLTIIGYGEAEYGLVYTKFKRYSPTDWWYDMTNNQDWFNCDEDWSAELEGLYQKYLVEHPDVP